ncbi:hypothetical protein ACJW31_08G138200 [Castanea mollissima]
MERAFQLLFESKVWFVALVFLSTQTTDIERGREKQIIKKGDLVPIWYFRLTHYSHQAELFDSKVGTNLLDIISQRNIHFSLEGNALKTVELTYQLAHDLQEKNEDLSALENVVK